MRQPHGSAWGRSRACTLEAASSICFVTFLVHPEQAPDVVHGDLLDADTGGTKLTAQGHPELRLTANRVARPAATALHAQPLNQLGVVGAMS
jgi:hypothetical protein